MMSAPKIRLHAVLPLAFACVLAVSAIASERGLPLITVFPAEVHKAGPQTFDLAQDSRGILYFGNLHGLLSPFALWAPECLICNLARNSLSSRLS